MGLVAAIGGLFTDLGVSAGLASFFGDVGAGAIFGGLGGGAIDAATGKPVLQGVETGALAGAGAGAGIGIGGALGGGVADVLGGVAGGAAGGALGGAVTGQNVGTGALTGAVGGGLSGAGAAFGGIGGSPGAAGTAGAAPGVGAGAGGIAAPAGTTPDIGIPLDVGGGSLSPSSGIGSPLDVSQGGFGNVSGIDTSGGVGGGGAGISPVTSSTLGSVTGSSGFGPGDDNIPTANVAFNQSTPDGTAPPGSAEAGISSETIPVPPVPPALDASGNPEFDASGNPIYPTQGTPSAGVAVGNAYGATGPYGSAGPLASANGSGQFTNAVLGATPDQATGGVSIGSAGSGNPLNQLFSSLGNFASSHSNLLIPAAGLGYEALKANQGLGNIPGYNQLQSTAGQLSTQGQQLQSYLQSGTLPPGVQTQLNQAQEQAEAQIRGMYAARGMSGSSAEVTDLNNVKNTVVSQGTQIAMNLLNTGVNESNLSASLYSQIMNAALNQDNQLGQGIAALGAASARPTINLSGSANG